MSDKPERVFTGSSKNPTEYVREDIVQEMLQQQRHMCAKDSRIALFDLSPDAKPITAAYVVEQACINAVEKNEGKFSNISNYPSGMNYIP